MLEVQLENANAHTVQVQDKFISHEPSQYSAHNHAHVAVIIILHTHDDDTTSDNDAVDDNSIVTVHSVFTHITAVHAPLN